MKYLITGITGFLGPHLAKILIENKLWGRSVVQAEVVKFIRDIDVQKCCGIFLSQNGKITTKENFEKMFVRKNLGY
jgi:nucleoside-diphosphate-sugar epimerase